MRIREKIIFQKLSKLFFVIYRTTDEIETEKMVEKDLKRVKEIEEY